MGKIVSQRLATKDDWIFSKSVHFFHIRKNVSKKKSKKELEDGKSNTKRKR